MIQRLHQSMCQQEMLSRSPYRLRGVNCLQESGMHHRVEGINVLVSYKTWDGMFRGWLLTDRRKIRLLVLFVLCGFCSFCLLIYATFHEGKRIHCVYGCTHAYWEHMLSLGAGWTWCWTVLAKDMELQQPPLYQAVGFDSFCHSGSAGSVHRPERA